MIGWKQVTTIEIDPKACTVTLKTAQGYPLAKSEYNTFDGAMFNADKAFKMMMKEKGKL